MRAGRRALAGLNKAMRHLVGCGKIGAFGSFFQVHQGYSDVISWSLIKITI